LLDTRRQEVFLYIKFRLKLIPSPDVAREQNIKKITRTSAVDQINEMEKLASDLGRTVVSNQIVGETITTSSPVGVKMIMSK
jgi:hypothetical protein